MTHVPNETDAIPREHQPHLPLYFSTSSSFSSVLHLHASLSSIFSLALYPLSPLNLCSQLEERVEDQQNQQNVGGGMHRFDFKR